MQTSASNATQDTKRETLESVVIRFSGDSGDGMQLTGAQFTTTTAMAGNDLATFPDFPAEIRAPAGTTYGVSGFQIHFASYDIKTPGDAPDVLVAMNPAALKVNLEALKKGGLIIVNSDAFTTANLNKAGYASNPLQDGSTEGYRVLSIDIHKHALESVKPYGLGAKDADRCKNLWTLGLMYWMFGRECAATIEWLRKKFSKDPNLAEANIAALNAGHIYGENAELPHGIGVYRVPAAKFTPGVYRNISGSEATAWGLIAGAQLAGLKLFYGSYPITPASNLLHTLAPLKQFGVTTFQAEDEIAAVGAAIGASFGGVLGVTGTSGPGIALKQEAISLAISTELPLVVVDVQRGGPSTGLPTKTEQSDLYQAVLGRNGDAPVAVVAAATPGDCFYTAIEAVRLATKYMTPVFLLSDGYIANGAEPWAIPTFSKLLPFKVKFREDKDGFHPFLRDPATLARVWAKPGMPGLMHRIGGIEKDAASGNISYAPSNHQKMTDLRAQKILGIADDIPPAALDQGKQDGDLLVVSWGSTYGAVSQAVQNSSRQGKAVAHLHIRYMWPLQRGIANIIRSFKRVLCAELNNGQLTRLLRSETLVDIHSYNKIAGQPFSVAELDAAIDHELKAIN